MILYLKASGIVAFHFWGSYNETIALTFQTQEDAALALVELNKMKFTETPYNASGYPLVRSIWMRPKDGRMVGTIVTGSDIEVATRYLRGCGADPKRMHSMAKSIDRGKPFEVVIPVYYNSPDQLEFNFTTHDHNFRHTPKHAFTRHWFTHRRRHPRHRDAGDQSA